MDGCAKRLGQRVSVLHRRLGAVAEIGWDQNGFHLDHGDLQPGKSATGVPREGRAQARLSCLAPSLLTEIRRPSPTPFDSACRSASAAFMPWDGVCRVFKTRA